MSSNDKRPSLTSLDQTKRSSKLGTTSGVYIPVYLNILSILMFLRFGQILGQVGLLGMLGLLVAAYLVDFLTTLSLSAIASNGEVKGGGAYYLISRSLGPEFGGSIGVLFYLAQVLNTAMNVVGLIDCIRLNMDSAFPAGYWAGYGLQTMALLGCAALGLAGSGMFAKTSNGLLVILSLAVLSIPVSAAFKTPFHDEDLGIEFTGLSFETLLDNFTPHEHVGHYQGFETFRKVFGILFPATSGIFAGASMSGDLREPSRSIPKGTLWAMLTTFIAYLVVIFSMAASTTRASFVHNTNIIRHTSLSAPLILAGEVAVTFFSAVMGLIGAAKLMQALARDKLLPGLGVFGQGTKKTDEPMLAILLTYAIAQVAMLADLNQIATFISMGYQMTFFVMNLACFLLKIGSAPNFRPAFKFFSWQTAFLGSLLSAACMFFIDDTYAAIAVCVLIFLFSLIHYLSPPKRWGDVSQNLIYHQVRKYLLRLRPEHIKFWRPQIILLINNPRSQTRLIRFCNSIKKGSLYILGHVIVTDDFKSGVQEAKLQQAAWTNYILESSRIKAFVQLTMSPTITWGIRNLILSAGLGGMRPNIAVVGFYNMDELRRSQTGPRVPDLPTSPTKARRPQPKQERPNMKRRRGDTSARILEGFLPTDVIKTEDTMSVTSYMTMLEDLALQYKLNVAVGKGFENLETPRKDKANTKKYIDLWPIQMSAEVLADGKSVLTTNFDTYTLILQLGYILHSVPAWKQAYTPRVMVFVEYESEVAEETARVQALLEKLRIEAEVHVFWLACGSLKTYELIINGRSPGDLDLEIMVNDVLGKEEWWDELQMFRGADPQSTTPTQGLSSLTTIFESTAGRPGLFNPHISPSHQDDGRRASYVNMSEIRKNPTASRLRKLGVNMGIHTSHLGDDVFEEEEASDEANSDTENLESIAASDAGMDDDDLTEDEYQDYEVEEAVKRPLLSRAGGGRSVSDDILGKTSGKRRGRHPRRVGGSSGDYSAYGTMQGGGASQSRSTETLGLPRTLSAKSLQPPSTSMNESFPDLADEQTPSGVATPLRPALSRQSSAVRFSSRPVPETKVMIEESGPTIMFASADPTPRAERPAFSRQSSNGWRPSETPKPDAGAGIGPAITFAEPTYRSRRSSVVSHVDPADAQLDMAEILARYRMTSGFNDEDRGSVYSTQGIPLSFNDLPSRAQHLVLNELMRQHSADTAVMLTTLPIPSEGTCHDEEASVQYLSDIEVLCHELPPVLLVLSNNMTVTVGL
ncbi:solute carrier family 12 member 3 [Plectosphaerella plurivora]|uniref:Solute carrier family 12 member 3 n=1 Tax=Plectosphaerella plurivora TaxID=936078 RepID=A0A9P8V8X6_9PEZI|nr:solute carrier family 12 member 3 [Plectosphaerella plurivora]